MKLRFKHLIPALPKYLRNYKGHKVGDVLESRVFIVCGKLGGISPNDPSLLDKEVSELYPVAQDRRYSCRGNLVVYLKE